MNVCKNWSYCPCACMNVCNKCYNTPKNVHVRIYDRLLSLYVWMNKFIIWFKACDFWWLRVTVHICTCVYTRPCVCVYTRLCVCVYTRPCACVYTRPCTCVYTRPCTCVYTRPCTCVYTRPCACVYSWLCTCFHIKCFAFELAGQKRTRSDFPVQSKALWENSI
jgi:hypothetical protein